MDVWPGIVVSYDKKTMSMNKIMGVVQDDYLIVKRVRWPIT